MRNTIGTTVIAVLLVSTVATAGRPVHHALQVRLDPAGHDIRVIDRIGLEGAVAPDSDGAFRFVLHAGLRPEVVSRGWRLEAVEAEVTADFLGINATTATVAEDVPLEGWRLFREEGADDPVEIRYGGVIHHPLATQGEEYQRSFSETPGIIEERGVFLSGTSFWVPTFGDRLLTFDLEVAGLEPPWDVVSQGRRAEHELTPDGARTTTWTLTHPTEEIYLVAGPWHEYADRTGKVNVFVFLREDDPGLARRYLDATTRYLKLYEAMLPAFPFASFALVENFWETGYGMPGFTLLGSRVIRFPWILTSSYPHELLHNWWGNSAYVDFERGNWCEGLTAYMADHLFAEQRGEGATHRRAILKKFSDFVSGGNDLPLVEFTSRRSAASEAVGYGKSSMLFHMLRRAVGDDAFLRSLRRFYDNHRFTRTSFEEIAAAFAAETGGDWKPFIDAWTTRSGAPQLEITAVAARDGERDTSPWVLTVELRQSQEEAPFPITVPIAVTIEGQEEPLWVEAGTCDRTCAATIPCPGRPLAVAVDPAFDVMRRLDPLEVPPALSTLFGAGDPLVVLPAAAAAAEVLAWRELAASWTAPDEPRTVLDTEIDELPAGTVWVVGWSNRFGSDVASRLREQQVAVDAEEVRLSEEVYPRPGHSLVLVARAAHDPGAAVGWVAADPAAAIPGLARKLPHYSRYSYLAFRGDEPQNVAKGMWRPLASPLVRRLAQDPLPPLEPPAREALAELPPVFDAGSLGRTVERLAGVETAGRGLGTAGLDRATAWVEEQLARIGLEGAGDDGFRQSWTWVGGEPEREMTLTNLVARLPATTSKDASRPVLVMAHLDHLGRGWPDVTAGNEGQIHPGADDNASGVAVLLELARAMAREPARPRPVLFAVVTGEEAGRLGSRHLLERLEGLSRPFACLNLDTVGRLFDGTIHVLNADTAREWRFIFMGVGYTTGAPISIVAEPLDSSDQASCIAAGVPAVQLFTGPHADYHRPSDTAQGIDPAGMATVAEAAHEAVTYLAERTEPLTVTIAGSAEGATGTPPREGQGGRRVSLGTMPDFTFPGPGVKVQQVMPGSAALAAGIAAGDVIVAIGDHEIAGLRALSDALKTHSSGDQVTVTLVREGEEITVGATLTAR